MESIDNILKLLSCPLNGNLFINPVIANDGVVYEKDALEKRYKNNNFESTISQNYKPVPLISKIIEKFKSSSFLINSNGLNLYFDRTDRELKNLKEQIKHLENSLQLEKSNAIEAIKNEHSLKITNDYLMNEFSDFKKKTELEIHELEENNTILKKTIRLISEENEKLKIIDISSRINNNNSINNSNLETYIENEKKLKNEIERLENLVSKLKTQIEIFNKEYNTIQEVFLSQEDIDSLQKTKFQDYIQMKGRLSIIDEVKIIVNFNRNSVINYNDKEGSNAILISCYNGCSYDIIKYLIDLGIDYKKKDKYGGTALIYASRCCSKSVIELLISLGLNISDADSDNCTALHNACRYNTLEVVKLVFNKFIEATNYNKQQFNKLRISFSDETILHLAVFNSKEVVEFISDKVNLDLQKKDGNTALHLACYSNSDSEIIKLLLSMGASISIINKDRLNPIEYGIKYNEYKEVVLFLKELNKV